MPVNSIQKVTNKVLIIRRKNADPNKGVAFRQHLDVAQQVNKK